MSEKLLLIGGGGHCKSVLDSLLDNNNYQEIGIVDSHLVLGEKIFEVPVIGRDQDLVDLFHKGYNNAFVTVGSIGNPKVRKDIYSRLKDIGFNLPNIIDKTAVVSKRSSLREGIFVGKNAVINAKASIGICSIINSSVTIEHDCIVSSFAHIAPGSTLCGEVEIGENTHIGANSVIRQQLKVGSNCIVGFGSVVTKNLKDNVIAYGNPCREV